MSEEKLGTTIHQELEVDVTNNLTELIELGTYSIDLDLLDSVSGFADSPTTLEMCWDYAEIIGSILNVKSQDSIASIYRSFNLAYTILELVSSKDFSIDVVSYVQQKEAEDDLRSAVYLDIISYFRKRPYLSGFMNSFADELDMSGQGKDYDLVAVTFGLCCKLAEESVNETEFSE